MRRLAGLTALAGLLLAAGTAHAYDFDIGPSLMGNPPVPVEGASGTYHVTITQLDNSTWQVVVKGNDDGKYQDAPVGSPSPGAPFNVPKSGAGRVSLNFNGPGGVPDQGLGLNGATTAYVGPGPGIGVHNNVGGPLNHEFGNAGGEWFIVEGSAVVFTTPFSDRYIAPHGGNMFVGTLSLQSPDWERVGVSMQDSGQQWSGEYLRSLSLVPEPSSLALLLPGLLPLAVIVRKRRR